MGNVATYSIEKVCEILAEDLTRYKHAKEYIRGHEVIFILHELLQRLVEPQSKTVNQTNFPQDPILYRLPPDAAQLIAAILLDHRGTLWPELKTQIMADSTPPVGSLDNAGSTEKVTNEE